MKTIYESTGKGYETKGDYQLPNIKEDDSKEYHIGVWGQRYRRYLKNNHRVIYYNYLTAGTLYKYLSEVDNRAEEMFATLVKTLAEQENITENLKADDMMMWVKKMNGIRNRATEIVNNEVIFV